ncbi:hypothetical protein HZC07_06095, partial [Candidatus Micrarchaeota archaeon]|nr:hypothetical protein [Candidatus Micrarchaeota archaeon]
KILKNPDNRIIYDFFINDKTQTDEITINFETPARIKINDNLSKDLGVGKGTIIKMIDFLVKANVITPVSPYVSGKSKVRKESKYLFTSSAIRSVILTVLGEREREVGLTREDLFAMHIDELFYLKEGPDYVWKNTLFEVGGPSKTTEQFRHANWKGRKYIVYESEQVSSGEVFKLPFYIFLSGF